MKKTILFIGLATASSLLTANAATLLTVAGNGGTIDGTTTTYSIGAGTTADAGGNGISFTNADPITITFSSAVDIVISATSSNDSFVFDTLGNFTTVGGALNYTVGADDAADTADGVFATFSGNGTNTFSWTATGAGNADKNTSDSDWGTITANGVTSLSFTNTEFRDAFSFTATAVPEPSSTALLGLGGLALLARRRR